MPEDLHLAAPKRFWRLQNAVHPEADLVRPLHGEKELADDPTGEHCEERLGGLLAA